MQTLKQTRLSDLYPIACLQWLGGLRPREAACWQEQDVDFVKAMVRIDATARHKPKTRYNYCVIPVAGIVLEAIGPDRVWWHSRADWLSEDILYDPTNGTIIFGNIVRTQLDPKGKILCALPWQ